MPDFEGGTAQLHEAAKWMTEAEMYAKRFQTQKEACLAKVHKYMEERDAILKGPPCLRTLAVHPDECARQFLAIAERLDALCNPLEVQKQAFGLRADLLARVERALASSGAAVDAVAKRHLPMDDTVPPALVKGAATGDTMLGAIPSTSTMKKGGGGGSASSDTKKKGKKKKEEEGPPKGGSLLMHILASKYDSSQPLVIDYSDDVCENCGEQKRIIYASSTRMCPNCKVVERYTTDAMLTAGQNSGTGADEAAAAAAAAAMRRNKPSNSRDSTPVRVRIRACLLNAQWKESFRVPVHLIQWLREVCAAYGYSDLSALDPITVEFIMRAVVKVNAVKGTSILESATERIARRMIAAEGMDPDTERDLAIYPVLKREMMQRYYQYSTQVTCCITGKAPPHLEPEVEEELLEKTLAADRYIKLRHPDVYGPGLHRAILHFVAEWMRLDELVPWLSRHMFNITMDRIRPVWEELVRNLWVSKEARTEGRAEEVVSEYMTRLNWQDLFKRRQLPSMIPRQGLQAALWAKQLATRVPEGWRHVFLRFGMFPYLSPYDAPDARVLDIATFLEPAPGLARIAPNHSSPPPAIPILLDCDADAPYREDVEAAKGPVTCPIQVEREGEGDTFLRVCAWNVDGLAPHLDLVQQLWKGGVPPASDASAPGAPGVQEPPDVLCLSEIKLGQNFNEVYSTLITQVPYLMLNPCRSSAGGHQHGTGMLLRQCPIRIWTEMKLPAGWKKRLGEDEWAAARDMVELEGRVIAAEIKECVVVCVYVPASGTAQQQMRRLKLRTQVWDPVFRGWVARLQETTKKPVVVAGDWNVVRRDTDMHKPKWGSIAGCMPAERENMQQWIGEGWTDTWAVMEEHGLVPAHGAGYTLWARRGNAAFDGNKGSRVDAVLVRNHGRGSHVLDIDGGAVAKHFIADTKMDHAPLFIRLNRSPR